MENMLVELYQDSEGQFHFEFRQRRVPRSRLTPCGQNTKQLRHAAWFPPADPKGSHHFAHACETCLLALKV